MPEPEALFLSVEPAAIGLFGEARITARALRSSVPVPVGTEITVSTSLGRLDLQTLLTDSDGRVVTRLRGTGAGGTATLTARLGGTTTSATATVTIGVGRVLDLRAEPSIIESRGSAQVVATLTDDGRPVSGTQIQLSASLGRLENPTPRTDSLGHATTRLLGNGANGTAVLTASTQGVPQSAEAEVLIGSALVLSLSANPTSIPAAGSSLVTLTVRQFTGGPGPPGLTVRLSTDLGRLDRVDLVTDSQGIATTTLRGDGRSGTATLTAEVDGAEGPATTSVTVGAGPTLSLSANPAVIPASGTSTLSAVLSEGGGAISGAQIVFTTTLGRIDGDRQNTNAQGIATTRLIGQGVAGTARITASSPSTGASAEISVTLQP
ncbi:MAG: hypothetical protein KDD47_22440 [Acidobacteria bacterium]|nr:hypothetical protein [Acidobacteriota bacterium]